MKRCGSYSAKQHIFSYSRLMQGVAAANELETIYLTTHVQQSIQWSSTDPHLTQNLFSVVAKVGVYGNVSLTHSMSQAPKGTVVSCSH